MGDSLPLGLSMIPQLCTAFGLHQSDVTHAAPVILGISCDKHDKDIPGGVYPWSSLTHGAALLFSALKRRPSDCPYTPCPCRRDCIIHDTSRTCQAVSETAERKLTPKLHSLANKFTCLNLNPLNLHLASEEVGGKPYFTGLDSLQCLRKNTHV